MKGGNKNKRSYQSPCGGMRTIYYVTHTHTQNDKPQDTSEGNSEEYISDLLHHIETKYILECLNILKREKQHTNTVTSRTLTRTRKIHQ
jgi:hypothetical protein